MKVTEDSLVSIINEGKEEGYIDEFKFDHDKKCMINNGGTFKAHEMKIDGMRRLEGMSNPADSMIYYQLSTIKNSKGYFVDAYGPKGNVAAMNFLTDVEETSRTIV